MDAGSIALVTPGGSWPATLLGGELKRRDLPYSVLSDIRKVHVKARVIGLALDGTPDGRDLMEAIQATDKPVVALKLGTSEKVYEAAFRQAGAVVACDIGEFVAMLAGFAQRPLVFEETGKIARSARNDTQVEPMNIEGAGAMDEYETKRLLDRWAVPVVPETLVTGPGRHEFTPIRKLATHMGFPVALKAIHRDIVRKSDVGAVVIGIPSIDHLKAAWEDMHTRFPDAAWLVQPFLPGDVELIVRADRHPAFGAVVTFGPGGIMTELYEDVSVRVAPFGLAEAIRMIEETKAAELLRGFRGLPAYDLAPIAEVLTRVGDLTLSQPTVQQITLDPLLVTQKGPVVVDAKATIG